MQFSEADGERILRQWKYMLLYFRADGQGSTKYALESFYILLQYYALLSPRDASRLIWNRSVKSKHGKGGNIPLDMALEHYNGILKVGLRNMGPNNTNEKAIDRFCQSLEINKQILGNFDTIAHTIRSQGKHKKGDVSTDLQKLVTELLDNRAMENIDGRKFKCYQGQPQSLLNGFNLSETFQWLYLHKSQSNCGLIAR